MEQIRGRFSVILPYYNGRKYIKETIDSILAQNYENFELLIIDDGSPNKIDSSFLSSLVESMNDPRIKYYCKNNSGLSETRNFGIDKSNGEFIAFIDQDDLWDKEKLSLQAEVFVSDETVNFVCTDAANIGEKSEAMRIGLKWGVGTGLIPDTYGKLLRGNFVVCSSAAFRRSALAGVGYSNRMYAVVPDYEYFLRFAERMDFYFIERSLLLYRLHEGNTTKQQFKGACEVLSVLFDRKPRRVVDRVSITIHFLRYFVLILFLWINKVFKNTQ
jgi:glycosyltransferase involved in cell wall biosynthesis